CDRLAAAAFADDRQRLARIDRKTDAVDRLGIAGVGMEVSAQVAHVQQRPVSGSSCSLRRVVHSMVVLTISAGLGYAVGLLEHAKLMSNAKPRTVCRAK